MKACRLQHSTRALESGRHDRLIRQNEDPSLAAAMPANLRDGGDAFFHLDRQEMQKELPRHFARDHADPQRRQHGGDLARLVGRRERMRDGQAFGTAITVPHDD